MLLQTSERPDPPSIPAYLGSCNSHTHLELARVGGQGWENASVNEDKAIGLVEPRGIANPEGHRKPLWVLQTPVSIANPSEPCWLGLTAGWQR